MVRKTEVLHHVATASGIRKTAKNRSVSCVLGRVTANKWRERRSVFLRQLGGLQESVDRSGALQNVGKSSSREGGVNEVRVFRSCEEHDL